jgi:hypothetical protein
MSALFFWLWIAGGFPAIILGEIMRVERPWILRGARIAFAFLLGADLLLAAVAFAVGTSNADERLRATRSIWWITVFAGGVPLALISGLAVRRGYTGRRLGLVLAILATAALYFSFPFGFVPADRPLTGLGRFEHEHHALDIAVLLIPTLILLANELRGSREVAPGFDDVAGVG